ncbi:MAG: molybdopterin-guanine dinucleotide biosynthesis protein B [Firmicutes bacterium]|nr:molybdopterin-guanine dinucleotide biosynthesis protein B [Bacillota bacterium]
MTIPVVAIVGQSGSGKTTLICGVLPILKAHGYRVATIKHDVHGFELDTPGKDTWKHAHAGADIVVISSREKFALLERVVEELTLDQVIARITNVDLILVEGYKHNDKPKIEVFRASVHAAPLCSFQQDLLAIVSDVMPTLGVPVFSLDDYEGVVSLLEEKIVKLEEK